MAGLYADDGSYNVTIVGGESDLYAAAVIPPYVDGLWYHFGGPGAIAAGVASTVNVARFYPFVIQRTVTVSEMGMRVGTTDAAGSFQLAVYANDNATMRPTGSELGKTGNLSAAAAVVVSADVTDFTLTPGIYWGASNRNSATATTSVVNVTSRDTIVGADTAADAIPAATTGGVFYSTPLAFGTWGDLSAAVWTEVINQSVANIIFRVAP